MTKPELEKLLNGPEWVLPLMQDISAGKITRAQVNDIFDYMERKEIEDTLIDMMLNGDI